jgi:hypothetical protein
MFRKVKFLIAWRSFFPHRPNRKTRDLDDLEPGDGSGKRAEDNDLFVTVVG